MTAPKMIRTNAYGTALVTDFGEWKTDIHYIRADAPELVALVSAGRDAQQALVDAAEEIAELRLAMSKTDLELPWIGDAIDQLRAALAAYEGMGK